MPTAIDRLSRLRAALAAKSLDAYVIVSSDPHLSEYLPQRWRSRQWLTGFTGSAGSAVVTASDAFVWADSRYWEQAEAELAGSGFALMRAGAQDVPELGDWLAGHLSDGARVGIDGNVLSLAAGRRLEQPLLDAGMVLDTDTDLFDVVWSDRPGMPPEPIYEHDSAYTPRTRAHKLQAVRAAMAEHGAQAHVLSSLDDIAWLTNLRGSDVDYNPVFVAHAIVDAASLRLFVQLGKIDDALAQRLAQDGVQVCDYDTFGQALAGIGAGQRVLIDPARVTRGVMSALADTVVRVEAINPSTLLKSCKTDAELVHIRNAMVQDGAALCAFFHWYDTHAADEPITELTIDERLSAQRRERPGFVSLSFPTIAGFNGNGAMPHYRATAQAHSVIEGDGLLLIDSGAQYVGGTTDITRVVPVGTPTEAQKRDVTLVLKGMINLSLAQFPVGLPAPMLDVLARAPIWAAGAEYGHGTGHGVGYFLNVHEGPQVIAWRASFTPHMAMRAGMITSNEPGLYRAGQWGVRIENLVANVTAQRTELGDFLRFETLTLCPIDTRCLKVDMLTPVERDWLNAYHQQVQTRLSPLLAPEVAQWLAEKCAPLPVTGSCMPG